MEVELKTVKVELDENGYLVDPDTWSREVSEYIAEKEGITLTEEHWKVIEHLRKFYKEYRCVEMPKKCCRDLGMEGNCFKRLFGPSIRIAEKIAGLPRTQATT
jgi:tRNA 2-thiouridine synthesizing protein E